MCIRDRLSTSNAWHDESSPLPSEMLTPRTSSSTATLPPSSQSPTQPAVPGDVGVGLCGGYGSDDVVGCEQCVRLSEAGVLALIGEDVCGDVFGEEHLRHAVR